MRPSTPGAVEKVREAMAAVERAQHALDRACQLLSPVRRGLSVYEATGREVLRCRALWDRVRRLLQREGLSLDTEQP